jgi:hypothetical protein
VLGVVAISALLVSADAESDPGNTYYVNAGAGHFQPANLFASEVNQVRQYY